MEIPIEKGQEELPFYRALITALTEHTPVGIYAMENGALTYANDSYAKPVGYAAKKIRPAEFGFLEPGDCPMTVPLFSEPDDRRKGASVRFRTRHKDGHWPFFAGHVLSIMKEEGNGISFDDFDTGYTSLNYLRECRFDKVKIDRPFIEDINRGLNGKQITSAIILLAHSFHMKMVAEDIENEIQHKYQLGENCNDGQGYYFSRPLPADSLAGLLSRP
ncbi:EAL domain-containing protein [Paenibacillus chitinolyticus]|uniref:EAL domain-containing protein n=1 Tax=Paenibacillus chitinolyticus TaxID=79263 RepID=UPI003671C540